MRQDNWLKFNGFEEQWTAQQNMMIFRKILDHDYDKKYLEFTWYNSECGKGIPGWWITIVHDGDDIVLVNKIPNDEDFMKFQPLIDLIK